MCSVLINRKLVGSIAHVFRYLPVITLTGPRQAGKTTLCRQLYPELPYVNLEETVVLEEAQRDVKAFLNRHPHGLIIDEAQNYPEIFSALQVLVDEDRHVGRTDRHFIVTGSNSFMLMERSTQSMAGRTAVMSLLPLSTAEILAYRPQASTAQMILNGGYPAVWTAGAEARTLLLSSYYTTYIERDVRRLINLRNLRAFQQFVRLCAGRIGQEFNAQALSNEVGVSVPTIKDWLSVLCASFVVHLLPPYYANIGKRLIKTPKLYFYDTGLAAFLLGITTEAQLEAHPLRGSLFENMVVNDFMKFGANNCREEMLFFYRDKSQREVDVLRQLPDGSIEAYEIKSSQTVQSDFYANLNYLRRVLADRLTRTTLIFDGDQENRQPENGVVNFRRGLEE